MHSRPVERWRPARRLAGAVLLIVAADFSPAASRATTQAQDFEREIQPILRRSCVGCHGPALAQGGLSLASRESALRGGSSWHALVPGNAAASLIVERLSDAPGRTRMPIGLPALAKAENAALRTWIAAGAAWPGAAASPDFVSDIQPILRSRCTPCHGPELLQSQLRLDSRAGALRGGLSGA